MWYAFGLEARVEGRHVERRDGCLVAVGSGRAPACRPTGRWRQRGGAGAGEGTKGYFILCFVFYLFARFDQCALFDLFCFVLCIFLFPSRSC